ncbi:MAG TPA: CPBP family glutamic-type intramembrane protease [Chitinophagaceae bacterium]|nr:CPBP family glutamic-type intramembrane protease [Chitinophagaceae bacterium]
MQYFFSLISDYARSVDKLAFFLISLFVGILVFINYRYGWESKIWTANTTLERFLRFYIMYLLAFAGAYLIQFAVKPQSTKGEPLVLALLIVIAPAIFAVKVAFYDHKQFFSKYAFKLLDYPIKAIFVLCTLYFLWRWIKPYAPFCGLTFNNFQLKPYLLLLACMIPLIALASFRPDFLHAYPKYKMIVALGGTHWYDKLLFEISYGIDFFTIEVFFRGFLVLAFAHFVGKDAILPMAAFYCVIHFGKPLPECISSYFGGLILGVLVYQTQTIIGGLLVHLGIAWLMEYGGYLGSYLTAKVAK